MRLTNVFWVPSNNTQIEYIKWNFPAGLTTKFLSDFALFDV